MKIMRAISLSCVVCLAGGILAGATGAWADDCDLASAAAIAQWKTPHADTHVTTIPGNPPASVETIFTDDKAYVQVDGVWRSMAFPAQEQIDTINAAAKRAEQTTHTCQKLAGEPINGEAASLLVMHSEVNGKASDVREWISDKTGLPLKYEVHLSGGMVLTDEFRYGAIKAPLGVK
jgi:hypothetical protein